MRILKLVLQKIKNHLSLFTSKSAIDLPPSFKYFSVGQQWILYVLAILILGTLFFRFYYHSPLSPPQEDVREYVVEVSGEVQKPGIYLFQNPPTLKEAIGRASGFNEPVDFDLEASSEILETGTLLIVKKEPSQIPPSPPFIKREHGGMKPNDLKVKIERMEAPKLLVFSIPLDLNRASVEDLCLIPGIGVSLAHEIAVYRNQRRRFRSVEELKHVKGIGEKKFHSFKTFFIIRD